VTGIALLYGRTGALNMAEVGRTLAGRGAGGLVISAFVLLTAGFLVKAAAVPFHFWLPDAYAVAPAPVCAVFAGVMSELGFYALARVHWTVFSGPFGEHRGSLQAVLVGIGVLTAVVGGVMCLLQRHLKRLLAFVTVAHGGLFLIGIALLTPAGLAGTGIYAVSDGLVKGSLFLGIGLVVHRFGRGDELRLRGRGRGLWFAPALFLLGALGLAGVPPFGTFLDKSLIEEAARVEGYGWLPGAMTLVSILTAAAVLRAAARIFLGWGDREDELLSREPDDEEPRSAAGAPAAPMRIAAAALLVFGLGLALVPHLASRAERDARAFQDRPAYTATVLEARRAVREPLREHGTKTEDVLYGLASAAGAFLLAGAMLRGGSRRRLRDAVGPLKAAHSGHVGDYVAWITAGAAALGGLIALTLG
jgi:multicomponent Na+:H+ antiporter subunit D